MKNFSKSTKIIALILFSIFLYTCEDGLIEEQNTLLNESSQLRAKGGNGNGGGGNPNGNVYYDVTIIDTFVDLSDPNYSTADDIIITGDDCVGSNSNSNDLVWFDDGCATLFTTIDTDEDPEVSNATALFLHSIRLGGVRHIDTLYGVGMYDDNGNNYVGTWEWPSVKPFDPDGDGVVIIALDKTVDMFWKYKEKGVVYRVPAGSIRIGTVKMRDETLPPEPE